MAQAGADIDVELQELEARLERLRALYEQYFIGIEKIEPSVPRQDVDRRIHALRKSQIRNTAKRFRLQTIIQRYNAFQQYWLRVCREIENGTYHRHVARAQSRFGDVPLTAAARRRARLAAKNGEQDNAPEDRDRARRAAEDDLDALLSEDPEIALQQALRAAEAAVASAASPRKAAPVEPPRVAPIEPFPPARDLDAGWDLPVSEVAPSTPAPSLAAASDRPGAPGVPPPPPPPKIASAPGAVKPPPPRRRSGRPPGGAPAAEKPPSLSPAVAPGLPPVPAPGPDAAGASRQSPPAEARAPARVAPPPPAAESAPERPAAPSGAPPVAIPAATKPAKPSAKVPRGSPKGGERRANSWAALRIPGEPAAAPAPTPPKPAATVSASTPAARPAPDPVAGAGKPAAPSAAAPAPKPAAPTPKPAAPTQAAARKAAPVATTASGPSPAAAASGRRPSLAASAPAAPAKTALAASAKPAAAEQAAPAKPSPRDALPIAPPATETSSASGMRGVPPASSGAARPQMPRDGAAEVRAAAATAQTAAARAAEIREHASAAAAASRLNEQRVGQLHADLVAERRRLKQPGKVSMEALGSSLRETENKLRKQYAGKNIDFHVVVKDGKAMVKPIIG